MSLPRGLVPLGERNYALYVLGHAVSHSGTAMEVTATSWVLYELTGSPLLLGLAGLVRTAPIFAFVLIGGAVADRFPRRPILFMTQLGFLTNALVLGTLVATGIVAPWHIYLISFLNATLNAFDVPTRQALFPSLVPRKQVAAAVTLNAVASRSGNLVGPAVAGLVMALVSNAAPFFLNAASYLALVAALLAMRMPSLPGPARATLPLPRHLAEGVSYALGHRVLLPLLVLEGLASLFGHNTALLTIFARDVLQTGPEGLGLLRAAVAAGALVGMATLVFAREVRRTGVLMLIAALGYATALGTFALSGSLALSLAALAALGLADALWSATRNVAAQVVCPEAMRGRIMSLVVLVTRGTTHLAELQAGALIVALGPAGAALTGAAVIAGGVTLTAIRRPALRHFSTAAARRVIPGTDLAAE